MPARAYFEVEVRLLRVEPAPWRRFQYIANGYLHGLHLCIQEASGWTQSHLYAFAKRLEGKPFAGIPESRSGGEVFGRPTPDAERVLLKDVFTGNVKRIYYQYDFGDNWWHEVKATRVKVEGAFVRRLLAGELAFPPEDCGGTYGYERMKAVATTGQDPEDEDPAELLTWLNGWRPDRFDLAAAQAVFDVPQLRRH